MPIGISSPMRSSSRPLIIRQIAAEAAARDGDYAAIQCPVYAVGGWTDGYKNAIPRLITGLKVPRKGLIGPWAHSYPHFALPGPQIGFLQEILRWWDYWLKGIDTGYG